MAAATALMLGAPVAHAQATLTWGATGAGGTGTWDTSAFNWFNGSAAVRWTEGSNAIFGGTPGVVTVGTPITVQDMTFPTNGYTITNNTLTLSGSTPTTTTNAGVSATVDSALSGSAALAKTGPGTAILTFANTYNGVTTLNGGILRVSGLANGGIAGNIGQATNAAENLVFNGGTLQYTSTGPNTDRLFTLGAGGGTIDASGTGGLNFTNTGAIGFGSQVGSRFPRPSAIRDRCAHENIT